MNQKKSSKNHKIGRQKIKNKAQILHIFFAHIVSKPTTIQDKQCGAQLTVFNEYI